VRPNILIFMSDQEQADVVHPDHPCLTPNATRLAREGILFRRAYCPTAHCCPSRATFMTGVYPSRHGVYNNVSNPTAIHQALNPGVVMFSELLHAAGYNLAFAGKWHVSNAENPSDRGWEEVLVTAGKGSYMHRSLQQWSEQAQHPEPSQRERGQILRPGWGPYRLYGSYPTDSPKGYEEHHDYRIVSAGISALRALARRGKPWVLFIGVNAPHDPFMVPERFVRMFNLDDIPLPPNFHDTLTDKPRIYQRMRRQLWSQLSEEEVRESIQHYWAYCTMVDAMFGEVLDALEETGQADDTLILRLSDHGDYCGAHGLYLKGVPAFREAYNIVAIARWRNGIINPNREVGEFITLADFAPTFLELADVPLPRNLTGRSLVPFFLDDTPADWTDACFTQFNGVELYYSQRSVITKDYKFVYNGFDFDELYDLRKDPHEMVNLNDDPHYQEVKRDLVRRMWEFAAREDDEIIFNSYATVALAPWGPAEALRRGAARC